MTYELCIRERAICCHHFENILFKLLLREIHQAEVNKSYISQRSLHFAFDSGTEITIFFISSLIFNLYSISCSCMKYSMFSFSLKIVQTRVAETCRRYKKGMTKM